MELGSRMSLFAVTSTLSGAFSGLLAYAIAKMSGTAGLRGWRWIFIIEGIFTVFIGIICPLLIPDSPDLSSRWLSEREIRFIKLRQQAQFGSSDDEKAEKFQWKILLSVLTDWKILLAILIYWSNTAPNFGIKVNMPSIMKTMGYTSANAQLMTIPPYFVGACGAYITGLIADRYKWRMPFIVVPQICILVSFAILLRYVCRYP
jgi:MFS family permease